MLIRSIFAWIIIIAAGSLTGCEKKTSDLILDVPAIINKTPEEVVAILGEPDSTYTERILNSKIFCQRYRKYNIEIQYPDQLSTDVVVYGPHGLPFTQSALKSFNVSYQKKHPSQYEKEMLMRWYDIGEFEAISFYNVQKSNDGGIDNFSIFFKAKGMMQ